MIIRLHDNCIGTPAPLATRSIQSPITKHSESEETHAVMMKADV